MGFVDIYLYLRNWDYSNSLNYQCFGSLELYLIVEDITTFSSINNLASFVPESVVIGINC